jgi:hypothetical protein
MHGTDIDQGGGLFSYVSMEQRIPLTHPLRRIRALLDEALRSISRDFDRILIGTNSYSGAYPERTHNNKAEIYESSPSRPR